MTPDFRNLRTDFHNFIEPFSKTFNEFLAGDLAREIRKNSADAQLAEAIIYCLKSGGKRLRPALFFLCAGLRESQIQETVATATPFCRLATALEMFHTYTLVHDDLPSMDNADTRRGLPSCHKKYSQWLAILVGDALNTLAFQQLAQSCYADAAAKDADADADSSAQAAAAKDATAIDADADGDVGQIERLQNLPRYLQILTSQGALQGLLAGQAQDLCVQKGGYSSDQSLNAAVPLWWDLPRHQKKKIYWLKTGSLFACSCAFGAIFSGSVSGSVSSSGTDSSSRSGSSSRSSKGSDARTLQSFMDFGLRFGYFFQLLNDLADWPAPVSASAPQLASASAAGSASAAEHRLQREKVRLSRLGDCLQKEIAALALPQHSRNMLCSLIAYLLSQALPADYV